MKINTNHSQNFELFLNINPHLKVLT